MFRKRISEFAIADTCFLIDWVRYRYRDSVFGLFKTVFVPESVINEVKSEHTIAWIASNLAKGSLSLYSESVDEVEEARIIIEESRRIPCVMPVDLPEALCLAVGRRRGYIVLTENKGAIMYSNLMDKYRDVTVWRALELITAIQLNKLVNVDCSDLYKYFSAYESDAKHVFPRKDLEEYVEMIRNELCR